MTTINILFWLLVALLGGIVWAIESGLAQRNRSIIMSSAVASLCTMVFLMFWVADNTKIVPLEEQTFKRTIAAGEARGLSEEVEIVAKNPSGKGSEKRKNSLRFKREGKAGPPGSAEEAFDELKEMLNMEDVPVAEEGNAPIVYNRQPFNDCPVCPSMVIVPEGVAQVGAGPEEVGRAANESLAQPTPVPKPFAVGRIEITRSEFASFADETDYESIAVCDVGKRRGKFGWRSPGFEQDPRHPATCLSVDDVTAYLAWLKQKTGRTYRLPTEVEWEHAARAGTDTPYWMTERVGRRVANIGRQRDGTTPGGMLAANPWGLGDQIGNVREMTSQCLLGGNTVIHEIAAEGSCRRLLKGGSWASHAFAGRHAARSELVDGGATNDVGFRVVRDIDERDDDKIMSLAERQALLKAEEEVAEQERKQFEDAEEARRKAREKAEAEAAAELVGKK